MYIAKVAKGKIPASNYIIDEAGLVGDGIRSWIKENIPYARIYVLGDKYQISSEYTTEESPFTESKYNLIVTEN
jgi:hypothetical protein